MRLDVVTSGFFHRLGRATLAGISVSSVTFAMAMLPGAATATVVEPHPVTPTTVVPHAANSAPGAASAPSPAQAPVPSSTSAANSSSGSSGMPAPSQTPTPAPGRGRARDHGLERVRPKYPLSDPRCQAACASDWVEYSTWYRTFVLGDGVAAAGGSIGQDLDYWRGVTQTADAKVAAFQAEAEVAAVESALGIPGGTWGGGPSSNGSSGDPGSNSGTPTGLEASGKGEEEEEGVLSEQWAGGGLALLLHLFAD